MPLPFAGMPLQQVQGFLGAVEHCRQSDAYRSRVANFDRVEYVRMIKARMPGHQIDRAMGLFSEPLNSYRKGMKLAVALSAFRQRTAPPILVAIEADAPAFAHLCSTLDLHFTREELESGVSRFSVVVTDEAGEKGNPQPFDARFVRIAYMQSAQSVLVEGGNYHGKCFPLPREAIDLFDVGSGGSNNFNLSPNEKIEWIYNHLGSSSTYTNHWDVLTYLRFRMAPHDPTNPERPKCSCNLAFCRVFNDEENWNERHPVLRLTEATVRDRNALARAAPILTSAMFRHCAYRTLRFRYGRGRRVPIGPCWMWGIRCTYPGGNIVGFRVITQTQDAVQLDAAEIAALVEAEESDEEDDEENENEDNYEEETLASNGADEDDDHDAGADEDDDHDGSGMEDALERVERKPGPDVSVRRGGNKRGKNTAASSGDPLMQKSNSLLGGRPVSSSRRQKRKLERLKKNSVASVTKDGESSSLRRSPRISSSAQPAAKDPVSPMPPRLVSLEDGESSSLRRSPRISSSTQPAKNPVSPMPPRLVSLEDEESSSLRRSPRISSSAQPAKNPVSPMPPRLGSQPRAPDLLKDFLLKLDKMRPKD
jgi:hypothetical protein